jgi:hypothetical protein
LFADAGVVCWSGGCSGFCTDLAGAFGRRAGTASFFAAAPLAAFAAALLAAACVFSSLAAVPGDTLPAVSAEFITAGAAFFGLTGFRDLH